MDSDQPPPAEYGQQAVRGLTPDQANALAQQGATLLLLGVPSGTQLGIDFHTYTAGPKFSGLKMIPPGLHFLSHTAVAKDSSTSPIKAGFWFYSKLGEVLVRVWSAADEEFEPAEAVDSDQLERYALAVRQHEFDRVTGPYPYDSHSQWQALTPHITRDVLARHRVALGPCIAGMDLDSLDENDELYKADPRLRAAAEARAATAPPPCVFTPLHPRPMPDPETGAISIDRSAELRQLLRAGGGGAEATEAMLAEFELAFTLFMLLSSWSAFEQWKRYVVLLCSCDSAVQEPEMGGTLFLRFLQIFRVQLQYTPKELFQDELAQDNFLQISLSGFFESAPDASLVGAALAAEAQRMVGFLENRFGARARAFPVDTPSKSAVYP